MPQSRHPRRPGQPRECQGLGPAALTASHRNPLFIPQYKHLIERGKPVKVALTAIARKLLVHLNTQLKEASLKT